MARFPLIPCILIEKWVKQCCVTIVLQHEQFPGRRGKQLNVTRSCKAEQFQRSSYTKNHLDQARPPRLTPKSTLWQCKFTCELSSLCLERKWANVKDGHLNLEQTKWDCFSFLTAAFHTVDANSLLDKLKEWVELRVTVPNWETSY